MKSFLPALSLALAAFPASALLAAPIAVTYTPPSQSTPLVTTFVSWEAMTPRTTPVGQARAVFDNPTPTLEKFEVHVTTLLPGRSSHPVHQHAWEEMILVKEGNLDVSINGQSHHAGPGYLVFFASHDPHNLTNVGDTPATYYVVVFYTDLVHTVPDRPAVEQAVPGLLPSSVIDVESIAAQATPTGSRVSVLSSPTHTFKQLIVHLTTLNPGKSSAPDIMDSGDELFLLKSGVIEVKINGVAARIKAGSLFYCVPNDKRTLRNIGTVPATYEVLKVVSDKTPKQAGG